MPGASVDLGARAALLEGLAVAFELGWAGVRLCGWFLAGEDGGVVRELDSCSEVSKSYAILAGVYKAEGLADIVAVSYNINENYIKGELRQIECAEK
ncbi:hypothetical protein BS50DRAFT_667974 [Corynespora cassiicola Philippines]|uniref:Uncharacterized protein n=1 Tax=Corynespora cassiicola Philippines TaxID=1448308 RepID=A0A2T2NQ19_CORCC|nr:hypothetical protein BS50DRAFT_667974 [Corynespora cassiicola Philippines]